MEELNVCLVQANLVWENKTKNLSNLYTLLKNCANVDVFFLPEMFATGFTMDAKKNASTMQGEEVTWMKNLAAEKNACVTGSLVIEENLKYYNRLLWVEPDGTIKTYNKRHLFTLAGEEKVFEIGTERIVIEYKGWRLMPQVCYDLRFPVWSRNNQNADVIFYVANWPEKRGHHWRQLLMARAIENQCFVVGVNRVGTDGNGHDYCGDSAVINALGNSCADIKPYNESVTTVSLRKSELQEVREKFAFLEDQDLFEIKV